MALQFAEKLRFLNEWEGHEFTRAVKSLKVCLRFSARGVLFAARRVSPQPVRVGGWHVQALAGGNFLLTP